MYLKLSILLGRSLATLITLAALVVVRVGHSERVTCRGFHVCSVDYVFVVPVFEGSRYAYTAGTPTTVSTLAPASAATQTPLSKSVEHGFPGYSTIDCAELIDLLWEERVR